MQGDELLGTFSFIGTITKEKNLPDVFRDADLDSPDMEHIDWQTVRDDTEGFNPGCDRRSEKTIDRMKNLEVVSSMAFNVQ